MSQIQPETGESLVFFFKTLIQLYLLPSFIYSFIDQMKKWGSMRQLRPETGESLSIFFETLIQLYLFCLFLYFWLTVSKRASKAIFLDIKFKSLGIWGSYGMKQGNPLQDIKIANRFVFVLCLDLLFYLMYQKCYQM